MSTRNYVFVPCFSQTFTISAPPKLKSLLLVVPHLYVVTHFSLSEMNIYKLSESWRNCNYFSLFPTFPEPLCSSFGTQLGASWGKQLHFVSNSWKFYHPCGWISWRPSCWNFWCSIFSLSPHAWSLPLTIQPFSFDTVIAMVHKCLFTFTLFCSFSLSLLLLLGFSFLLFFFFFLH